MVGIAEQYYGGLSKMKETLFGFYKERGVSLENKQRPKGLGTTWGYHLNSSHTNEKPSGSSIGENEIKLFYDICSLVHPSVSYVIGHSFGFSTLVLALSSPESLVIAIDNWTEGSEVGLMRRLATEMEQEFKNHIHIYTGTSPEDTPEALRPLGNDKLGLVFIDGLHTNEAAFNDFKGVYNYIDDKTLILWHGAPYVYEGVSKAWEMCHNLYDKSIMLQTWGPTCIFLNSSAHPLLMKYLKDCCLVWNDWKKYLENIEAISLNERFRNSILCRLLLRIRVI